MDDSEFDRGLIGEVFELIAEKGWHGASVAEAARNAGMALDRARVRMPGMTSVLVRFGRLADQAALSDLDLSGSTRDVLFGMVMRRVDFLQSHRAGVRALLRGLPADPLVAVMLAGATLRSMAWILEAAGISASGPAGLVRAKGMMAVWLWTVRAWQKDQSEDLSGTMAALDVALSRAEQAAGWLGVNKAKVSDAAADGEAAPADEEELPMAAIFTPPDAPASPPV